MLNSRLMTQSCNPLSGGAIDDRTNLSIKLPKLAHRSRNSVSALNFQCIKIDTNQTPIIISNSQKIFTDVQIIFS